MSNIDKAKIFPKPSYYSLKNQNDYECQGSKCSCGKEKEYRTSYDKMQAVSQEYLIKNIGSGLVINYDNHNVK
jgi:hypothetical protein